MGDLAIGSETQSHAGFRLGALGSNHENSIQNKTGNFSGSSDGECRGPGCSSTVNIGYCNAIRAGCLPGGMIRENVTLVAVQAVTVPEIVFEP